MGGEAEEGEAEGEEDEMVVVVVVVEGKTARESEIAAATGFLGFFA